MVGDESEGLSKPVETSYLCAPNTWCVFRSLFQSFSQTWFLASSVSVERTFSRGRILIPHLRNRLRPETVRALMCFGDWSREDFVSNAELVKFIFEESDNNDEDLAWFVTDD